MPREVESRNEQNKDNGADAKELYPTRGAGWRFGVRLESDVAVGYVVVNCVRVLGQSAVHWPRRGLRSLAERLGHVLLTIRGSELPEQGGLSSSGVTFVTRY